MAVTASLQTYGGAGLTPELCGTGEPAPNGPARPAGVRAPRRRAPWRGRRSGRRFLPLLEGRRRGAMAAEVPEERWRLGGVARRGTAPPPRGDGGP